MFAGDLLIRSVEYLDAFEVLVEPAQPVRHFASHFLLAHSLELALKSFLAASGTSKADIFDLGHRLKRILKRCKTKGLPEVNLLCELVAQMEPMNKLHDFRYPAGYHLVLPFTDESLTVVRSLHRAIAPKVQMERVKATLQFASDTRHLMGKKVARLTAIFAATALCRPRLDRPPAGFPRARDTFVHESATIPDELGVGTRWWGK
ncbi:MAG: hypothetical protein EOS76_06775 [Mesorhizobium sp.]|uniref:hypothetical protein n=1 Tax=unclassified Mesorhizobium TaxID=325217 RepID=UPI000F7543AD|nr:MULTISPECIES: hypothetical protein [unclassified Mesorhizobium]AZO34037.1 hypothetical protein EJ072_05605 [Mesorhizobium sp. M2A.F.Ca.ET.046.03.2.1]AZO71460.1 hypothetical protein EJ067_09955 [Mesorhizobium sp. M1D.F.Ca.ET.043.01.1.1]RWB47007.1 MAG: hypothetical protein EOQ44_07445 [Mesorhizobium sp.]RWE20793.1 MAG: hypothetical protein EOS76_06775 [Mesorhizobium sp.]